MEQLRKAANNPRFTIPAAVAFLLTTSAGWRVVDTVLKARDKVLTAERMSFQAMQTQTEIIEDMEALEDEVRQLRDKIEEMENEFPN